MKPTLQAVADAVGVSRSTVSNAYSRPDQLSAGPARADPGGRRQLGYPGPNPTARSLRRGLVGSIGVLFTSQLSYAFTDPYAVRFLARSRRGGRAAGTGCCWYHCPGGDRRPTGGGERRRRRVLRLLRRRRGSGRWT